MPFCAKCGASVDPNVQFCPSCGSPMGMSSAPPTPTPAGWTQTQPAYTDADRVALGKIKTFSLLGIVGILLGVIIPAATGFGFTSMLGFSTLGGATTGLATAILAGVAIGIIGFIIGIISILQIRSAFKSLIPISQEFSMPSKMVLGLFGGLALFVIGFLVLIAGLLASAAAGSGAGVIGTLAGAAILFVIGAILALIGIIGIILGLWRAGERYQEGLIKIGGILFIIPYADIVAPFLVYFGATNALKKIHPSTP